MPDRFTEEEARRVFARAAERQHAADAAPAGLSRDELEEIGRAAGLDPAHVAAAIAEVRAGIPDHAPTTVWGIDLEPRATRVVPADVSDEVWRRMVDRLRGTFSTRGTPTQIGRVREWTGGGGSSNLHATVEPVEGGTRVTLATSKAYEAGGLRSLPWTTGVLTVLLAAFVGFGDFPPGLWALPLSIVLILGAVIVGVRYAYARWSRQRQDQFDALLDQIEIIARADAASGTDVAPQAPEAALDLDALGPEAGSASGNESRHRTRS